MAALGITNQRETTLVWDRRTGKPKQWPCCLTCAMLVLYTTRYKSCCSRFVAF